MADSTAAASSPTHDREVELIMDACLTVHAHLYNCLAVCVGQSRLGSGVCSCSRTRSAKHQDTRDTGPLQHLSLQIYMQKWGPFQAASKSETQTLKPRKMDAPEQGIGVACTEKRG